MVNRLPPTTVVGNRPQPAWLKSLDRATAFGRLKALSEGAAQVSKS